MKTEGSAHCTPREGRCGASRIFSLCVCVCVLLPSSLGLAAPAIEGGTVVDSRVRGGTCRTRADVGKRRRASPWHAVWFCCVDGDGKDRVANGDFVSLRVHHVPLFTSSRGLPPSPHTHTHLYLSNDSHPCES